MPRRWFCGSLLPVFVVRVSITLLLLSTVRIAEWPLFGKELLTQLTICPLFILTICKFGYFQFWFLGLDLVSVCFCSTALVTFYLDLINDLGSDCSSLWSLLTFYYTQNRVNNSFPSGDHSVTKVKQTLTAHTQSPNNILEHTVEKLSVRFNKSNCLKLGQNG